MVWFVSKVCLRHTVHVYCCRFIFQSSYRELLKIFVYARVWACPILVQCFEKCHTIMVAFNLFLFVAFRLCRLNWTRTHTAEIPISFFTYSYYESYKYLMRASIGHQCMYGVFFLLNKLFQTAYRFINKNVKKKFLKYWFDTNFWQFKKRDESSVSMLRIDWETEDTREKHKT